MNCSNVGPSQGLQSLMNFPGVCPFHRLQSFSHSLLQRGLSCGDTAILGASAPLLPSLGWGDTACRLVSPRAGGAAPPPPLLLPSFLPDLGTRRGVPLPSQSPTPCRFPSSLCSPRGTTALTDGLGLGQRRGRLPPAEAAASFEQQPALRPLPCHQNPATHTRYILFSAYISSHPSTSLETVLVRYKEQVVLNLTDV